MSLFKRAKDRLSHVKEDGWPYKRAQDWWGDSTEGKACTFLWIKLPTSLILTAFFGTLYVVVVACGWFFGYVSPDFFKTKDPHLLEITGKDDLFYPYRYTSRGGIRRIVPWQVAAVLAAIALVWYLSVQNQQAGIITGIVSVSVVLAALALGLLVYVISTNWKASTLIAARTSVANAWNRACPPLVVVKTKSERPTE